MVSFGSLVGLDGLYDESVLGSSEIPIDVCVANIRFD